MMSNRRLDLSSVAGIARIVAAAVLSAAVLISCEYFDPLDPLSRGPRDPDPTVTWELVIQASYGDDAGRCVQQTDDGGFIIVGYKERQPESSSPTDTNVWLVKTDSLGNVEWDAVYGGAAADRGNYVEQTDDGGYIVVGYREFDRGGGAWDADLWLFKVKPDDLGQGQIEWEQVYGDSGTDEEGACVRGTEDGGFIITGTKMDSGLGHECLWLLKTDSAGNLDPGWTTNPQSFSGTLTTCGESVVETLSGAGAVTGYLAVGRSWMVASDDAYLVKTDASGVLDANPTWDPNPRTYGDSDQPDNMHSVQQTTDGGFILAGQTNSFSSADTDALLVKLDASGQLDSQWPENPLGLDIPLDTGFYEGANCVQQTSDGGYIIAGEAHFRDYDAWLVKLDALGHMEWEEYFGGQGLDEAAFVRETEDGGYIMTGRTNSFPGSYNLYLVYYKP